MKNRFSEEQIIKVLKRAEAGEGVKDLCREHAIHAQTYYVWKRKYAGMEISDARRLNMLEEENRKLKRLVADQALDILMLKDVNSKKW